MTAARVVDSKRNASLWRLGGFSPSQLARKVTHGVKAKSFLGRASELAFDFLFALFPLILFMLALFGLFASRSAELQSDFLSFFADFLPRTAFDLLQKTTRELAGSAGGGKLTIGILMAVWFASGGVSSMIGALNLAYRVDEARSWIKVRLVAIGLTLVISILLLAALVLMLASGHFIDQIAAYLGFQPLVSAVWKIAQWPAAVAFVLVSYSVIYYFGPNLRQRHWHWITPGSAFGVLAWVLGSIGFRIYLHFFNSYGATYGSLGAVMILLAWLYIVGLAFLIGGEINAEIERASEETHKKNIELVT